MKEISIYVHIPFCERKCNYCAFNSFCAKNDQIDEYIDVLCDEIKSRKCDRLVKTIYFGGGTPSILSAKQFSKVARAIFNNFTVDKDAEFTVEANPNSLTEEKLETYKKIGVNRLSVGVQSLDDDQLQKIGRLHNSSLALEKIALAKRYFDNVSADLLIGLEGQNGDQLVEFASKFLNLGVKHISCYLLEVYPNTKLGQMVDFGKYSPLGDDDEIDAFEMLSKYLESKNMVRYEISNFALQGFESRHNLNYWKRGEYLGFGLSAHSFEKNCRYKNAENMADYKNHKIEKEILTDKEICEESIMLGLRCNIGVSLKELQKYSFDLTKNAYFQEYLSKGILKQNGDIVTLDEKYYDISNTILSNLI